MTVMTPNGASTTATSAWRGDVVPSAPGIGNVLVSRIGQRDNTAFPKENPFQNGVGVRAWCRPSRRASTADWSMPVSDAHTS